MTERTKKKPRSFSLSDEQFSALEERSVGFKMDRNEYLLALHELGRRYGISVRLDTTTNDRVIDLPDTSRDLLNQQRIIESRRSPEAGDERLVVVRLADIIDLASAVHGKKARVAEDAVWRIAPKIMRNHDEGIVIGINSAKDPDPLGYGLSEEDGGQLNKKSKPKQPPPIKPDVVTGSNFTKNAKPKRGDEDQKAGEA